MVYITYIYVYVCVHIHVCTCTCRPLINRQVEEKVCGEGPCLEDVFEDDTHLLELNNSIQV